MEINEVTGQIVDAAMKVHTKLGPGLLESAYEVCLAYELRKRGLQVATQVALPIIFSTAFSSTMTCDSTSKSRR